MRSKKVVPFLGAHASKYRILICKLLIKESQYLLPASPYYRNGAIPTIL